MSDQTDPKLGLVTAELQEKAEKLRKVKEGMESLFHSLKKLETNLRSLQESALLLRQVLDKFQQLTPEQRAKVTQIINRTLHPTDKLHNLFNSSTLH